MHYHEKGSNNTNVQRSFILLRPDEKRYLPFTTTTQDNRPESQHTADIRPKDTQTPEKDRRSNNRPSKRAPSNKQQKTRNGSQNRTIHSIATVQNALTLYPTSTELLSIILALVPSTKIALFHQ